MLFWKCGWVSELHLLSDPNPAPLLPFPFPLAIFLLPILHQRHDQSKLWYLSNPDFFCPPPAAVVEASFDAFGAWFGEAGLNAS